MIKAPILHARAYRLLGFSASGVSWLGFLQETVGAVCCPGLLGVEKPKPTLRSRRYLTGPGIL